MVVEEMVIQGQEWLMLVQLMACVRLFSMMLPM
jgi:hypothetical protein